MNLVAAVRSEFTKLFTTSGWWILGLVLVVYIGIASGLLGFLLGGIATGALTGSRGPAIPADILPPVLYSLASAVGYVIPLLVGTLLVTGEYRHQTLTPTFLAVPKRGRALLAKVVVGVGIGALFAVVGLIGSVVPSAIVLGSMGLDTGLGDPDVLAIVARAGLAMILWAVLGVGLGALLRNQVVAVVLVLAFTQFVEPLLRAGAAFVTGLSAFTRVLPGSASDALVGASVFTVVSTGQSDPLAWWQGGLVLAAYAVVFLVLGGVLSWRRDVS